MFDQTIVMYLSRSGRACSCAMPSKGERERERSVTTKDAAEEGSSTIIGCAVFPPLEFVLNVGCVGWVYLNPSETLCLECKG